MDYRIIDDSDKGYIVVECPVLKENITLHPAVSGKSTIKDGILIASDDHSFVKRNIHAIRCNCSKCTGIKSSFMEKVKETGATIVDGRDKEAIKDAFKSLKS
jgi:hypothetical protein